MKKLLILVILLTGCTVKHEKKTYVLANGETVRCGNAIYGGGTTDLVDCDDGNSYMNQINLKRVIK